MFADDAVEALLAAGDNVAIGVDHGRSCDAPLYWGKVENCDGETEKVANMSFVGGKPYDGAEGARLRALNMRKLRTSTRC